MTYAVRRPAELRTLHVRDLDFQLYRWSGDEPAPLVLLHGWGDTGETFQFLVDELSERHTVLAYDARGFGRSQWPADGYWFPDYLADLDVILDAISPEAPVDLVGHSMGGNVVMLYAGVRPQRIRRVVSLEGFGMRATVPEQAPARYREWLDEIKKGQAFATYDSFEHFEQILARRNARTPADRLAFIARSWGRQRDDGRIELRADPRHKYVNPVLYQREQAEACWRHIAAPFLLVEGQESDFAKRHAEALGEERLRAIVPHARIATVPGAGHMVHHECPRQVAELIEEFLAVTP